MTDANGTPITTGSEVTTIGNPTPLTVAFLGGTLVHVSGTDPETGRPFLKWIHPSKLVVTAKGVSK